jgi:hypothetical protein
VQSETINEPLHEERVADASSPAEERSGEVVAEPQCETAEEEKAEAVEPDIWQKVRRFFGF